MTFQVRNKHFTRFRLGKAGKWHWAWCHEVQMSSIETDWGIRASLNCISSSVSGINFNFFRSSETFCKHPLRRGVWIFAPPPRQWWRLHRVVVLGAEDLAGHLPKNYPSKNLFPQIWPRIRNRGPAKHLMTEFQSITRPTTPRKWTVSFWQEMFSPLTLGPEPCDKDHVDKIGLEWPYFPALIAC